jgi:hypothetical protein
MQIVAKTKAPAVNAGAIFVLGIVTRSVGLTAKEGRDIEMIVALWRWRNRRGPSMGV